MDLYQMITDKIISELEKGTVPWHKPWKSVTGAISRATGRPYSVLNQLMLPQAGEYVTFKQAMDEGHPIKKGEKSYMVFFFKFFETVDEDTGEEKTIPLLKYFRVFHISQCEGMKPKFTADTEGSNLQPDEKAEQILNDYVARSGVTLIRGRSDKAFYQPATDTIMVPELSQFSEVSEFYSTAFHEATHSTGHPKRLNRITDIARFGSESYSKEELVAELGSSYLRNVAGVETPSAFQNSAAYIQGWLYALKNDKFFISSAAGKAEKAVKMILGEAMTEAA